MCVCVCTVLFHMEIDSILRKMMRLKPVKLHEDASALNALCLHMSSFTNRLNETGQNES